MKRIKVIFTSTLVTLLFLVVFSNCHKDNYSIDDPIIKNDSVQVQIHEATFFWEVEYLGKISSVVELSENNDMSNATRYGSDAMTENKQYSATAVGLNENSTYYYRFLVSNPSKEFKSGVKSFTTGGYNLPTVTTSKVTGITENSAKGGGTAESIGTDLLEKGICWGTEHNPTVQGLHASSSSEESSFTIEMTNLAEGVTYYVRAYASNIKGTVYGEEVSFYTRKPSPEGTINGLFSVSETQKVYFSRGNLQYIAVFPYNGQTYKDLWRLAVHQYDIIGMDNTNISSSYVGFIDLFGWAANLWSTHNGITGDLNPYAFPYETSYGDGHDEEYGPGENDLTGWYKNFDWGVHCAIIGGGNEPGLWRTMVMTEWDYVLHSREASTVGGTENARFTKGCVNGVFGIILFPDQYTHPANVTPPYGINKEDATGWMVNSYTVDEWEQMEIEGAVFLPVTGYRIGTDVYSTNNRGYYWSTTHYQAKYAQTLIFSETELFTNRAMVRSTGCSVRLVMDYHEN